MFVKGPTANGKPIPFKLCERLHRLWILENLLPNSLQLHQSRRFHNLSLSYSDGDLIISAKEAAMLVHSFGGIMPDPITQRLATLPKLKKAGLGDLWREIFGAAPPSHLRRKLMIPILAYRLQEQAFGAMSAKSRGRLHQLSRVLGSNSKGAIFIPSLKTGTRLVRQWKDQVHLVNVEAGGYEYQGARYQSLSEIARLITGTRWSGPLFFGLKNEAKANKSKEAP
jgi:Protein of unknown function (DUF2924)